MYLYIHIIITCLIFYRFPPYPNAEKEVVPEEKKKLIIYMHYNLELLYFSIVK